MSTGIEPVKKPLDEATVAGLGAHAQFRAEELARVVEAGTNLEALIKKLCPNGVAFLPLGELIDYEQPTKYLVKSKEYADNNPTPVLTAGQTFLLGYSAETDGLYPASAENPVIIFDDFTTSFQWVSFPFKAKSSAMKMLRTKDEKPVSLRYLYYAMRCIKYETLEHSRQWIQSYSKLRVPVPPVEVQEEIVRILDLFTTLEAELEARRTQYAHYRDALLSFNDLTEIDRERESS